MAALKITTNARKIKEKEHMPLVTLIFLIAGVLGMLLLFRSPADNDFRTVIVLPFAAALCWAIWFTYNRKRVVFWCLAAAAGIGIIAASFIFGDAIGMQGMHIIRSLFADTAQETMDMTVTAMILAVIASFALFVMEGPGRSHALMYLLTTALLLFAPLIDIKANIETAFLLILFQLAFWSVSSVTRENPRTLLFTSKRLKTAGKCALALSIVLSVSFLAALPLVAANSAGFFSSVYEVEGFIYRSVDNIMGTSEQLVKGGAINNGNNYPTGTPHIRLNAVNMPTESIYLRGFSGSQYTGGNWTGANDAAFFSYLGESAAETISDLTDFYYRINYRTNAAEGKYVKNRLSVIHLNADYSTFYIPYFSSRYSHSEWLSLAIDEYGFNPWEDSYAESEMDIGYGFDYIEQKDVGSFWDYLQPEEDVPYYQSLQSIYYRQARDIYTQVPTNLVPRITQLVRDNPLTELDEITAFIIYTLHSNAEYSLTPGWTPWGTDVADYFLFERKAGYCQHFALAATLMYRLYGVPARYATGYRADVSDFIKQEDGTYTATLTDADAHAWVEIFIINYGWVPIEVTPSANFNQSYYPGLSGIHLSTIWQEYGWGGSAGLTAAAQDLQLSDQSDFTDIFSGINIDIDLQGVVLPALIILTILFILALPLLIALRRLRLLKKYNAMGCRTMFYRLTQTLHFGGVMSEYDGSESDFAHRLSEAVPALSEEETENFVSAVSKAAFGNTPISEGEEELARSVYSRTADRIYSGLKLPKKLFFKYIKAYK